MAAAVARQRCAATPCGPAGAAGPRPAARVRPSRSRLGLLLAALALALAGCGYRFARAAAGGPIGVRLGAFENRTSFPGVEHRLLDALAERMLAGGRLEPRLGGDAPLELALRVVEAEDRSVARSPTGLALEREVRIAVRATLVRARGSENLWRDLAWSAAASYLDSADAQVALARRELALERAVRILAERIHDGLLATLVP